MAEVLGQATNLADDEARAIEYTIEEDLTSFGKGFTVLEQVRHCQLDRLSTPVPPCRCNSPAKEA